MQGTGLVGSMAGSAAIMAGGRREVGRARAAVRDGGVGRDAGRTVEQPAGLERDQPVAGPSRNDGAGRS